jgi:hypothetical protein
MSWIFSLYVAFLFFILTPAILVRLPPKAGKYTVAGFHAVVFALVLHFTGKIVLNFSRSLEGFQEGIAVDKARFNQKCNKNMMNGTTGEDEDYYLCNNALNLKAVNKECAGPGFEKIKNADGKITGCRGTKK